MKYDKKVFEHDMRIKDLNNKTIPNINNKIDSKADIIITNNLSDIKADKKIVDNALNEKRSIGVKITQQDLADEVLQQITGNTPINSIPANNSLDDKKYKDNSVIRQKINFYDSVSENLFNYKDIRSGGYYDGVTGGWKVDTTLCSSGFIGIIGGNTYIATKNFSRVFYDENYNFITGTNGELNVPFVTPSNARFLVISTYPSLITSTMVIEATTLPSYYIPFKVKDPQLMVDNENLKDGTTPLFLKGVTVNLLDLSKLTGGYYQANGIWVNDSTIASTSELIPVEEGEKYTQKTPANVTFWDATGKFVTGITHLNAGTTFQVPYGKNIKYAKVSVFASDANDAMLIKGTEYPNSYALPNLYIFDKTKYSFQKEISELKTLFNGTKLDRPSNGIIHFTVDINTDLTIQNTQDVTSLQDAKNISADEGILWLPDTYSVNGKPLKLVIFCHGSGETISSSRTTLPNPFDYLLNGLGYAVMDMNGIPKNISGGNGIHFGCPLTLQSYIKGYHYVVDNYNIDPNGCFVTGMSVGGLGAFLIAQSGVIPVLAQGVFCPVTDLYKQAWQHPWSTDQRKKMAQYFNFDNWDTFNGFTSTGSPSQTENDYFLANIDKVTGYNPIMKNTINWNSLSPYSASNESTAYSQLTKIHNIPLKVWHNDDDTTVYPQYSEYLVNSIRNTGGLAYLRKFPNGGHYAWDNGQEVATTDYKGNSYTVKASGFELGLWFKRFE